MKTVTSISGGKSSAYIAANYPADRLVFALVRIEDDRCKFPDAVIRRQVEDRIQKPFIATAEDDMIIYTLLDLEQYIGHEIDWVSGDTFDSVIQTRGGILPSWHRRYCTSAMKIEPIFEWWKGTFSEPVIVNIGYRANEGRRVVNMLRMTNPAGLLEFKSSNSLHPAGRYAGKKKWETTPFERPAFPLYENQIFADQIENFWELRPVRFAPRNNCVGCFNRHPMLLKKMAMYAPEKMNWFARQEHIGKGTWRTGVTYDKIINHPMQIELEFSDFSECDSGHCGL